MWRLGKLLVVTGFLGSFTTLSALSFETVTLFQQGKTVVALAYLAASVIGGLALTAGGMYLTKP